MTPISRPGEGTERLGNSPKFTQKVSGRAGIHTPRLCP